ncbi:MAG: RrF2 family transcriptional regulator [Planctomycetota bacterium]|jgi:Rrf2 family protein
MLQFTKRTEYGLIALVHLMERGDEARVHAENAREEAAVEATPESGADGDDPEIPGFEELTSAREISERFPLPKRLLAEVLKDLCRAGLVDSTRGARGGYRLARPAEEITLREIVAVLEGAPTLSACESSAASGGCEVEPICPIKSPIGRLRGRLWALLEDTSLRDLKGPVPAAVGTDSTDPIKAAGL